MFFKTFDEQKKEKFKTDKNASRKTLSLISSDVTFVRRDIAVSNGRLSQEIIFICFVATINQVEAFTRAGTFHNNLRSLSNLLLRKNTLCLLKAVKLMFYKDLGRRLHLNSVSCKV
jgi:hypothetical protein